MKLLRVIKVIALLCGLSVSVSAQDGDSDDVVRLVMPTDFAPYTHLDEYGNCSGLFIDLWQLWATHTGKRIECLATNFEDSFDALDDGRADVHTGVFESVSRRDRYQFAEAIYGKATSLVVKEGADLYTKALKIGVLSQSASIEWLDKYYPHFDLIAYSTTQAMIQAAIHDELDGFYSSSLLDAFTIISRAGNPTNLQVAPTGRSFQLTFPIVSPTSPISVDDINTGFAQLSDRLKLEIERRWVLDPQARYFSRTEILPLTEAEKAFIKLHPEVSVIFARDAFSPFTVVAPGDSVDGVDRAILDIVSDRTGLVFKPQVVDSWPQAMFTMRERMGDVITGLYRSESRDDYMLFSSPYYDVSNVIVTRNDAVIRRVSDLTHKTVAMPRGFYEIELLRQAVPQVRILLTDSPVQALMLVASGEAFAYVGASLNVNYLIEQHDIGGLKVASPISLSDSGLRLGVRTDWPELQSILSKALATISREEIAEIKQRWLLLPYDFAFERGVWMQRLAITGLIVVLVFFAFAFWNRRLSLEIAERARIQKQLVIARRDAEQAAKSKAHFLATMSHEIRTPLNGVLGMLELLSFSHLSSDQRKQLNTVYQSSKGLLQIINDVLDFSKSSEGKMSIVPVAGNLIEVVNEVVELFQLDATSKGLNLTASINCDHPYLIFDRMRFKQVLVNLVGNAIKFTHDGAVTINIDQQLQGNNATISVAVVDTGIGIDEKHLATIFTPFDQGDDGVEGRYGGSGLGLAISKEIVELMGGDLKVTSTQGVGATFSFTTDLGVASAEALASAPDWADNRPAKGPNTGLALIVDDHKTNIGVLSRQLDMLEIKHEAASSGDQALAMFKARQYRMVLTDIQMPGMDGFELARSIKGINKDTVVIAVTANDLELDTEGSEVFDAFLHKPVSMTRLTEALVEYAPNQHQDADATGGEMVDDAGVLLFDSKPFADLGLDAAATADLVGELRSETDKDLANLVGSIEQQDKQLIVEASHRMKGGASSGGLQKIAALALQIEEAARSGDLDQVTCLLPNLQAAVANTWAYLDDWCSNPNM